MLYCKAENSSIILFQISHYSFPSILATVALHYLFPSLLAAECWSCVVGQAITRQSNFSPKYSTAVHSEHDREATMVGGNV